jgi:predicted RNA-binding Zn ribbon-like protein
MNEQNVNLTISKDIVNPIVSAKIQEAVAEALGGKEKLIADLLDKIIQQRVDKKGNVSTYNSENKYSWLEAMVNQQIENAIKDELQKQIASMSSEIRELVIKQLQTKRGANAVATALLDGLNQTLNNSWCSTIAVTINPIKPD